MEKKKTRLKGFALVILATLIYSAQSVIARSVLIAGISPLVLAAMKLVSGFLTLCIMIIVLRKKLHFDIKDLPKWLIFGIFGGSLFALTLSFSFNLLGASQAVIYMYTAPAFTVIIAHFYLKEKINRKKLIAVLLVLAGTVAVAVGAQGSSFDFNFIGFLFGIGSGITYGIFSVMGKKLSSTYDSWNMNFFYILIGSLAISPVMFTFNWGQLLTTNLNLLLWIILYGAMIFGFGNYFFLKSMNYLEAGEVMIFANTEPILGVIFASIILAERLMPLQIIGFGFILIAIFLIAKSDTTYISLEG
ncbi:MAG: DMT family transporter [Firmicutes bacterium]|nr:DMT family transporter [Bacillota bacterium]